MPQLGARYVTVAVLVEMPETFDEILSRVRVPLLTDGREHRQKHLERYPVVGPVLMLHHQLLDLRLGGVLAQGPHHVADQVDADLAVAPVVVKEEGLVKLVDLVVVELNAT